MHRPFALAYSLQMPLLGQKIRKKDGKVKLFQEYVSQWETTLISINLSNVRNYIKPPLHIQIRLQYTGIMGNRKSKQFHMVKEDMVIHMNILRKHLHTLTDKKVKSQQKIFEQLSACIKDHQDLVQWYAVCITIQAHGTKYQPINRSDKPINRLYWPRP